MTFDELLVAVNSGLHRFLGEEKSEPISERTLRYWISKGVLSKRASRGPKTTYSESFVWRVILTRQYQLFSTKTLDEIAEVQRETSDGDVIKRVRAFRNSQRYRQSAHSDSATKGISVNLSKKPERSHAQPRAGDFNPKRSIEDLSARIENVWSRLDQSLQIQDEIIRQIDGSARQSYEVASDQYDRHSEQIAQLSMIVTNAFDQMRSELEKNSMRLASSVDDIRAEVESLAKTIDKTTRELEELKVALKNKKEED